MGLGWKRRNKPVAYSTAPSGADAERMAERYLSDQGLKLLSRNFACRLGEIDLVMEDAGTTVFVEVRYRKTRSYGLAVETVTPSKQRKLISTAEYYLLHNPQAQRKPARFDIIGIMPSHDGLEYTWLKNAFEGSM